MKKLMTMLSAVAVAIGLQAADTGTSFEGLTVGDLDITSKTAELDSETAGCYWVTNGSANVTLTVKQGSVDHTSQSGNEFFYPGEFRRGSQSVNDRILEINTPFGNPVTRKINADHSSVALGDAGFYFDSLVKFTAFDQDPLTLDAVTNGFTDAKIAVWLRETNPEDAANNATNLYVYAGNANGGAQAYDCGPVTEGWHRLTIKAVQSIYSDGQPVAGFAVFVDNNPKGVTNENAYTCIDTTRVVDSKYNNICTARALFPSLDQGGTKWLLESVSFDGQGSIDDVVFTDTSRFAAADDAQYVTIAWDANVASISIDGATYAVSGAGSREVPYTGADYTITATYAEGYIADAWVGGEGVSIDGSTVSFTEAGLTCTVKSKQAGASFNGEPYATLAEAVAAAEAATSSATLRLFTSGGTIDDLENTNEGVVITIDLNGQDVEEINVSSPVYIIDSTLGGTFVGGGKVESVSLTETGSRIYAGAYKASAGDLPDLNGWAFNAECDVEFVPGTGTYTGYYVLAEKAVIPVVAAHPWYENPGAVVLAENLPHQGDAGDPKYVSAFHGQGEGEYLGLTYSTNPLQFDLFQVDSTNAVTTIHSVAKADVTNPGFRGVAISKTLGIAMTMAYYKGSDTSHPDNKMYTFPLTPTLGGAGQKEVTLPGTHSFDAAAFSPDGQYLFSNALNGESSNQFYVKWSVAVDAETGALSLTKVGSISAGGRGRNLAYAKINGRDLVFAMVDTGKVAVIDMTGDTPANWTAADLVTDLPKHSYGTLCVSGVNVVDALGNAATPHLTVATANNNGATKGDVLNVYALTVPASGAVTASLVKSFDEDALTLAGFGDISDADRYGNTVYVTDDEATIYFGRPDAKLYAGQFAVARNSTTIFTESLQEAVDATTAGDTVTLLKDCNITTPLSISKNLTIHNDYTITGAVNYAICIGATVSFEGSGKIQRAAGITGSAFCVGANETTRGAITAGTAGTLIFNGGTVCGGSGGNLIKLENGTVTMNGGTLKDGLRGIKADADAGSYTSAIVINGGTITNCSAYAVFASAESANGKATITINGGEIAGPIGKAGKGDETITIPGTSAAKFDRDQSALCESGYETVSSDGWYVVQAIPSYTITFISGEGSTTNTLNVQRGAEVVAPTAAEVVGKTFDSWDPAVVTPAAGNAEYRAVYSVNTYAIKFVYGDNLATTSTVTTAYGVVPTAPSAETVAVVGKTFTGWNNEVVAATGAATYIAQYSVNTYAIKFVYGENLATTSTVTTAYGVVPTAPSAETVAVAGKNFDGWNNEVVAATADAIYIAQYSNAAVPKIVPSEGGSTDCGTAEAAGAAAKAINENKSTFITPPAGVTDTATYYSMVEAKAVGKNVVLEIADTPPTVKTAVKTAAETSAVDVVNGVENAAINVSAGLYYKITTDVSAAFDSDEGEGKTTIKGWSTGSVPVTKPGDTQGFIKVEVDAKPIQ